MIKKLQSAMSLFLTIALAVLFLCAASCRKKPITECVINLDTSASLSAEERKNWIDIGDRVLAQMTFGDVIRVLEINDVTGVSEPLFERRTLPDGAGVDDLLAAQQALKEAQDGAREAIRQAVSRTSPGKKTDVFSSIDRVETNDLKRTIIIYCSDMLDSAGDPNFEKVQVDSGQFAGILNALAAKHQWGNATLKDAQIYVIFPPGKSGTVDTAANDMHSLKKFYSMLFVALGGQLVSFSPSIPDSF